MMRLQLLALNIFVGLFAILPDSFLRAVAGVLSRLAMGIAKKDLRKLQRNLLKIYQLPPHSIFARTFALQVFRHQIAVAVESLTCGVSARHRNKLQVVGFSALKEKMLSLKAEGKGLIVVTGHMGNWELVAKYAADAVGESFYALAKPAKSEAVTQFLEQTRHAMGIKVLWTNKKSILRDMVATLKKGSCLGFVMDQKPEGRIGPLVNFFGQRTEFVAGPAKLAIRTKAPVLAIFCMREGWWQYRLLYKEIVSAAHDASDDVKLTQIMASEIESVIRLYPEQWVWNYKRWQFKPGSEDKLKHRGQLPVYKGGSSHTV